MSLVGIWPSRRAALLILLCALAFTPRFLVGLDMVRKGSHASYGDGSYVLIARSILNGEGYAIDGRPTAWRVPGYPLFLALVYLLFGQGGLGIVISQSLVAALLALCLYRVGAREFDCATGVLAGVIYALYPYLIKQDIGFTDTNLFTLVLLLSFSALLHLRRERRVPSAVLAGLASGVALLVRPTVLPCVFLSGMWLFAATRRVHTRRRALGLSVLFLAVALVLPGLWGLRNLRALGRYTLGTNLGLNLFKGSNAFTFHIYPRLNLDLLDARALRCDPLWNARLPDPSWSEVRQNDYYTLLALHHWHRCPWLSAFRGLVKVLLLFDPRVVPHAKGAEIDYSNGGVRVVKIIPRHPLVHVAHALSFGPVFLLFLLSHRGAGRDPYPHLLVWCFVLGVLPSVFLTFALTRFRAPFDVLFILFASKEVHTLMRNRGASKP